MPASTRCSSGMRTARGACKAAGSTKSSRVWPTPARRPKVRNHGRCRSPQYPRPRSTPRHLAQGQHQQIYARKREGGPRGGKGALICSAGGKCGGCFQRCGWAGSGYCATCSAKAAGPINATHSKQCGPACSLWSRSGCGASVAFKSASSHAVYSASLAGNAASDMHRLCCMADSTASPPIGAGIGMARTRTPESMATSHSSVNTVRTTVCKRRR